MKNKHKHRMSNMVKKQLDRMNNMNNKQRDRMNKMNTECLTITLQIRIRIIAPHPDPTNSSAKSGSKCIAKYEVLNRLQSPPCEEMAKTEVD